MNNIKIGILSSIRSAGYLLGGFNGADAGIPANNFKTIDRFSFKLETFSTLPAQLSQFNRALAACTNNGVAGYTFGGEDGVSVFSHIDKLLFSTDSITTIAATINLPNLAFGGLSNSGIAGYCYGGFQIPSGNTNLIQKLTFSTESRTNLPATLSAIANNQKGLSNEGVAGYIYGFNSFAIQKLTFSNETRTTIGPTTLVQGLSGSGFSHLNIAGYFNLNGNTIRKLVYSTETRTTLSSTLSYVINQWGNAFSDSKSNGYFLGGFTTLGDVTRSENTKLNFATETTSLSAPLLKTNRQAETFSNYRTG